LKCIFFGLIIIIITTTTTYYVRTYMEPTSIDYGKYLKVLVMWSEYNNIAD